MSPHKAKKYVHHRLKQSFRADRAVTAASAIVLMLLGAAAALVPYTLFNSARWVVGWILLAAGILQIIEALGRRGLWAWLAALFVAAVDIILGVALVNEAGLPLRVLIWLFGGLFILDGALQLGFALKLKALTTRLWLVAGGSVAVFAGLLIIFQFANFTLALVGWLVGIKLALLGATLLTILRHSKTAASMTPREMPAQTLRRIPGAVYAAYFGGAFHTGLYIGHNEVVDHMFTKKVRRVGWEKFANGRPVQMWEYPDLKLVPKEKIIETALKFVHQELPFNLITNNCEHFAIYCLTGGKTTYSKYAQNHSGLEAARLSPILGPFIAVFMRIIEYAVYKFGGFLGKRASLRLRKTNALLNQWIIEQTRRGQSPKTTS